MKHLLIGTAGHVDHGKTSLIKCLTDIDTDRLKEEKKRGITIDLGFAHMKLPGGESASIIDVPGHEKFVKNMLAGAGGIDLVLLVIAADDGVMPQTREHLGILEFLGTREGIVVITKTDLVDSDWLGLITEDVKNFVTGTFLKNAPIAYVSTHTGEGINELREHIVKSIACAQAKNIKAPPRLPVDRVFTMDGFGTVVTGTLIEGSLTTGSSISIFPKKIEARIRGLQVHGLEVETAYAGQRVAVNLSGIGKESIKRGDTLAIKENLRTTRMLDVKLSVMKDTKRELRSGRKFHFHYGTASVLCKAVLFEKRTLSAGMEAYAQLRFAEDIAMRRGDPFVLRFYSPTETIGGGKVLNEHPKKFRPAQAGDAIKTLENLEHGDVSSHIFEAIDSAGLVKIEDIKSRFALPANEWDAEIGKLLEEGMIVLVGEKHVFSHKLHGKTAEELRLRLKNFHGKNPLQLGIKKEELRSQAMPKVSPGVFDALLLVFGDFLKQSDGKIGLVEHKVTYTKEQEAIRLIIEKSLLEGGYNPPGLTELMDTFPKKEQKTAAQVMEAMINDGLAVLTEPGIVFHKKTVEGSRETLIALGENGAFTLAQFRDAVGTSRKFALSLLEHFDRTKFTKKTGDLREVIP